MYMRMLSRKPTRMWFTPHISHSCDMCVLFKLWVICTVHISSSVSDVLVAAEEEKKKNQLLLRLTRHHFQLQFMEN